MQRILFLKDAYIKAAKTLENLLFLDEAMPIREDILAHWWIEAKKWDQSSVVDTFAYVKTGKSYPGTVFFAMDYWLEIRENIDKDCFQNPDLFLKKLSESKFAEEGETRFKRAIWEAKNDTSFQNMIREIDDTRNYTFRS